MNVTIVDAKEPVTNDDIERLEEMLKAELPEDYKDFFWFTMVAAPNLMFLALTNLEWD